MTQLADLLLVVLLLLAVARQFPEAGIMARALAPIEFSEVEPKRR
jgi:hypothetical protein